MENTFINDNYPQTPPEPPSTLEGRINALRNAGAFVKVAVYDKNEGTRVFAHEVLDTIVDKCVEQEEHIETLQNDNGMLKENLRGALGDNIRLQSVNKEALDRLSFYETDGEAVVMHDLSDLTELESETGDTAGARPEDRDMQELLSNIQPDKWEEVVRNLRALEREAKEGAQKSRAEILSLRAKGDLVGVNALSKRLSDLEDTWNTCRQLAAKITFNNVNPKYYQIPKDVTPGPSQLLPRGPESDLKEIDLHHLTVPDALTHAWEHVLFCRVRGVTKTEIICGQGKHSKDGVPRIRPALLKAFCRATNVEVEIHKKNPGRLVVELVSTSAGVVAEANETMDIGDGM